MRVPGKERLDLECLAHALDGVRGAASPEDKLSAARIFATKLEEAKPALSAEEIASLRGGVEEVLAEVRRSREDLAGEIAITASRLERLRGASKLKVGGFGPGTTDSKV
jgi:hypothetical protein